jgi:hypothetical protein
VSRSTASGSKVARGKIPTEDTGDALARLRKVLRGVYREKVRVKSDYARKEADIIAMAASLQLITTKVGAQRFAKTWLITSKGLTWLNEEED